MRLRASRKREGERLSMMRCVWAFGSGGTSYVHGTKAELSMYGPGEKVAVLRRSRSAERWAEHVAMRSVRESRSMDKSVGTKMADFGEWSTTLGIVLRAVLGCLKIIWRRVVLVLAGTRDMTDCNACGQPVGFKTIPY